MMEEQRFKRSDLSFQEQYDKWAKEHPDHQILAYAIDNPLLMRKDESLIIYYSTLTETRLDEMEPTPTAEPEQDMTSTP